MVEGRGKGRPVTRVSLEKMLEHTAPEGREDLPPTSAPKTSLLSTLRDSEPGTRLVWEGGAAPGWARELACEARLALDEGVGG